MSTYQLPFTADDLVALAEKEVGVGEGGSQHNNNVNKFTRWYGVATPWCAIFTMWLQDQLGADRKQIPGWSAWVPTVRNQYRAAGQWVGPNDLQPGDFPIYDEPGGRPGDEGDHIGIVRKRLGPGHYLTVEGNWANAVRNLERYASSSSARIIGGCRPNYKPVVHVHKPAFYRLKPHDTLSQVAAQYGTSVKALAALNGIENPDKVPAGLCLAIPGGKVPTIAVNLARRAVRKGPKAAPDTWTLLNEWLPGDGGSLKLRYSQEQIRQGYKGTQPGQDADGDPGRASLTVLARAHGWRVVAHK